MSKAMKILTAAALLCLAAALCACAPEEPSPSDAAPAVTAEPEWLNQALNVLLGGKENAPAYKHFCWATIPTETGALNADGTAFSTLLPFVYKELPVYESDPFLDLEVKNGCRVEEIHVYDKDINELEAPAEIGGLLELVRSAESELIIDIVVVEDFGGGEQNADGYAFRIIPPKDGE